VSGGNQRFGILIVVIGILSLGWTTLSGSGSSDRPVESATTLSGLPWRSGSHVANELDKHVTFGQWRGRPNDVINIFTDRSSWEGITHPGWPIDNMVGFAGQLVISQPLWPKGQGDSAACACGKYDDYWKSFGSWLVEKNRADSIIRLGWEGNGDFMYWSVTDDDLRTGNWKACWRRAAQAIKSTNPRAILEWTINGHGSATYGGHKPYDVYAHPNVYPGDDVVDIVGTDSYDHYPPMNKVGWEKHSVAENTGLCNTISFARRHGKKFAVGEWGITARDPKNGGGDDTAYVQKMYDTFVANRDLLAYEGYYNAPLSIEPGNLGSGICPDLGSVDGQEASKLYQRLWSGPVVFPASNPCQEALSCVPGSPLPLSSPEREGFSAQRLERLHTYIRQLADGKQRSGAVTMIARHGRIVDWQTYGYRDLEKKLPMEKDTICRIYSMSKVITSVAVLMLMEEGRFELNEPVSLYLPEFKDVKVLVGGTADQPQLVDPKRHLSIKHLLTHTSGMVYPDGSSPVHELYRRARPMEAASLADFSARIARLPLITHPGDAFNYGVSTDILGALVERVSGEKFDEFLRTRIFEPLGMKDTFFEVPDHLHDRAAIIYAEQNDGTLKPSPRRGQGGFPSGGGGLYSTTGDYVRFAQMLLNGGQLQGVRILGRKTVELMFANHLNHMDPQTVSMNDFEGFGLGGAVRLDLAKASSLGSVGQFGWAGMASTYFRIDPQEGTVAILFMQHLPSDNETPKRFSTLFYQAIVD